MSGVDEAARLAMSARLAAHAAEHFPEQAAIVDDLASLRTRLAASDLERMRLRAGLITALNGWSQATHPEHANDQACIAELRKLVTP